MSYTIKHEDAFAFLRQQAPASIDLIISSPPYFMGKEYDVSSDVSEFIATHEKIAPLLVRALKPNGSLCWQVGNHVSKNGLVPLDAIAYGAFSKSHLKLRNRIIWTFGHGSHATKRFSGRHETILWYSNGERPTFNLDSVRVPQKYPGKRHYKGPRKGEYSGNPLGKNPGDVWDIPNVNARHVEKTDHPCQFPVALVQRLVRALSNPGDAVCDPFMGSGSTGVASVVEGRRFLGADCEKRYCEIAEERLRAASKGTARFRSIDAARMKPNPNTAVAKRPAHFIGGE